LLELIALNVTRTSFTCSTISLALMAKSCELSFLFA